MKQQRTKKRETCYTLFGQIMAQAEEEAKLYKNINENKLCQKKNEKKNDNYQTCILLQLQQLLFPLPHP